MTANSPEASLGETDMPLPNTLRTQILTAVDQVDEAAPTHHLAQMNIARFRTSMDDESMGAFIEMLDPLNHQAEATDGFVWRLTDEGSNNATSITFYDDPLLLVNMSMWEDVSSLRNYVYRTSHADMVKRRGEWADEMESRYIVLWWVPAGHIPTVEEGDQRLRMLEEHGPTAEAFTFGQSFDPPEI